MSRQVRSGQKNAVVEAFRAASSLLPEAHAKDFVLVGGTALIYHGFKRSTKHVKFLVTVESLHAFEIAASCDDRFTLNRLSEWSYYSRRSGINVPFAFLAAGGEFAPALREPEAALGGHVANIDELVLMKANAYMSWGRPKDMEGFTFLVNKILDGYGRGTKFPNSGASWRDLIGKAGEKFEAIYKALLEKTFD